MSIFASLFDRFRGVKDEEVKPLTAEERRPQYAGFDYPYTTHDMTEYSEEEIIDFAFPARHAVEAATEEAKANIAKKYEGTELAMDSAVSSSPSMKNIFQLGGYGVPPLLSSWYARQGFIGYQQCASMSQHWLINKACEAPAKDAYRNGWSISFSFGDEELSEDEIKEFDDDKEKHRLQLQLIKFSKMNRVFGIRVAFYKFRTNDPRFYEEPFDIEKVEAGSYLGIVQVDPYWCYPEFESENLADPTSIDFYEPDFWRIGGLLVHKSHLCITRYSEVSDIMKPAYYYGGIPLPQLLYERAYCADASANELLELLKTKRMNVEKIDLMAAAANPARFHARNEASVKFRNNYGKHFINHGDDYTQHETSLADVVPATKISYTLCAAISGVPATRLLEEQPTGLGATGAYDTRNYAQLCKTIQTGEGSELLVGHYLRYIRSQTGKTPHNLRIIWNPVDDPTSKEIAEIRTMNAAYYNTLQQTGAVGAAEIAASLNADKDSGFNDLDVEFLEETDDLLPDDPDEPYGKNRIDETEAEVVV